MSVDQQLETAPVLGVALAGGGEFLLRLRLPRAEQREATDLQVGRQLAVVMEEVVEELLECESRFVFLHIGHLEVVEEFEMVEQGVQQLGGQGSVAVDGHHEPVDAFHLPVATGEVVCDLLTGVRDVTRSFLSGLGLAGNVFMVILLLSEGLYFLFNLWVMLADHVEGLLVAFHSSSAVFSSVQQCSQLNGSCALVGDAEPWDPRSL
jgi:hypothetical protein